MIWPSVCFKEISVLIKENSLKICGSTHDKMETIFVIQQRYFLFLLPLNMKWKKRENKVKKITKQCTKYDLPFLFLFCLYVPVVMVTHFLRPTENTNKDNSFTYPQTFSLTKSQNVCFNGHIARSETARSLSPSSERSDVPVLRKTVTTACMYCV